MPSERVRGMSVGAEITSSCFGSQCFEDSLSKPCSLRSWATGDSSLVWKPRCSLWRQNSAVTAGVTGAQMTAPPEGLASVQYIRDECFALRSACASEPKLASICSSLRARLDKQNTSSWCLSWLSWKSRSINANMTRRNKRTWIQEPRRIDNNFGVHVPCLATTIVMMAKSKTRDRGAMTFPEIPSKSAPKMVPWVKFLFRFLGCWTRPTSEEAFSAFLNTILSRSQGFFLSSVLGNFWIPTWSSIARSSINSDRGIGHLYLRVSEASIEPHNSLNTALWADWAISTAKLSPIASVLRHTNNFLSVCSWLSKHFRFLTSVQSRTILKVLRSARFSPTLKVYNRNRTNHQLRNDKLPGDPGAVNLACNQEPILLWHQR